MPQTNECFVRTTNARDEAIGSVRHTAPAKLWPPFERRIIFGEKQDLFLKRDKRLRISRMIFGMLPFDMGLSQRQSLVLAILGPFLRDKDARKDVLGICKQMEMHPDQTIYYDVLLGEYRYFNGRVPGLVQNVQRRDKVLHRKRSSLDDYLYHCAVTSCTMPCASDIGKFMCARENEARDFFSENPVKKRKLNKTLV